jgi:uncharacterized membrane protein
LFFNFTENAMKKKVMLPVILSGLLLTACAQMGGYTPVVDTRVNSPKANANLNRDLQECQALAEQVSGNTAKRAGIGAGVGALGGAAAGAAIGAIGGNPGAGAAIGAVTGVIGGAAQQGISSDSEYKNAYNNCMRGRGHRVLQ